MGDMNIDRLPDLTMHGQRSKIWILISGCQICVNKNGVDIYMCFIFTKDV